MSALTVYYDDRCALCVRCRAWMEGEPALMPIRFVSCHSPAALTLHARGVPVREQLVVADDAGNVWVGPAAFIVCLWALEAYHDLSITLSAPALAWFAARFFGLVERRRPLLARLFLPADACTNDACAPYR